MPYYSYAAPMAKHHHYGLKTEWGEKAYFSDTEQVYFVNLKKIDEKIEYAWGLADSRFNLASPHIGASSVLYKQDGSNFNALHSNRVNMWFFDGHAQAMSPEDVAELYYWHSDLTFANVYVNGVSKRYYK